jgi:hypothetical protein
MPHKLNEAQIAAVFAEWERRAAEGQWENCPRDPRASARIFLEIARDLYPNG